MVGTAVPRAALIADLVAAWGVVAATVAMALASSGLAPAASSKRTASWESEVVFIG